jgi:hypothetical protein
MSDNAQSPVTELKVSGHTMALDPGIYCIFNAPGSTLPEPGTGLPTVRISAAPGVAAGEVDESCLDSQGWIGPSTATLVRVSRARSNVLVTVYQALDTKADAPQIQVVRLTEAPEASAPAATAPVKAAPAAATKPAAPKEVTVVAHIYSLGDVGSNIGEWVGESGSKRWIEGFGLAPVGIVPIEDIEYQAVLGRGWLSPWSTGGQFCGSRSMSLPILGLRVRLRGDSAKTHRIKLEATFIDGSAVGPVGDGEPCEAESLAALEAFCVAIEPIGAQVTPIKDTAKPAGKTAIKTGAKAATKTATKAGVKTGVKAGAKISAKPAAKQEPSPAPKVVTKAAKPAPTPAPEVAASKPKAKPAPARRR